MGGRSDRAPGVTSVAERMGDLALVGVLAAGIAGVIAIRDASSVGVLLSLPLFAILPGYALLALRSAGDDRHTDDPYRCGVLIVGASVGIVSALGIGLELSPITATHAVVTGGAAAVTLLVAAAAAVRRFRHDGTGPRGRRHRLGSDLFPNGHYVVVALTVLLAVAVIASVGAVGPTPAGFTEFYLLVQTEDGPLATDQPAFTPGQPAAYVIGIENRERVPANYTVVVQHQLVDDGTVIDRRELDRFSAALDTRGTWRVRHSFEPEEADVRQRLVYLLFRGSVPPAPSRDGAYRALVVWGEPLSSCHPDAQEEGTDGVLCPV